MALLLALLAAYRLPYADGTSRPLTQGNKGSVSHRGYGEYAFDFGMPEGTKVCAARDGKVTAAVDDETVSGGQGKYGGRGNHVQIDHGDGTLGQYFHLKPKGLAVKVGDLVLQGDLLGWSGATGNVTGPHLHFQVDRAGKSIPITFDDVEGGILDEGKSYASKNVPGIPAATKDKLGALARAAALAEAEGAWGLAFRAWTLFAKEKLAVAYPPQDEARGRLDVLRDKAAEAAALADPEARARSRRAFEGVPSAARAEAVEDPAARERLAVWDRYLRGLKDELEGRAAAARGHYKSVAAQKSDPELARRAELRRKVVEGVTK